METFTKSKGGRKVISVSTPNHRRLPSFFMDDKEPSEIEMPPEPKVKKTKVLDMVVDAINAIGVPKKGASYQAIKKWIVANNGEDGRLNNQLKLAVKKGIDTGMLKRPHKSESVHGAVGFFMVVPIVKSSNKNTKKDAKQVKNSQNGKSESPDKAIEKDVKKAVKKNPKSSNEDKKTSTKVPKKSTKETLVEKKPATKTTAKVKTQKAPKAAPKSKKVDQQSEEPENLVSPKKIQGNKQKVEKKDSGKSKVKEEIKDIPETKTGKGKVTKEAKKQTADLESSPKPSSSKEENALPKKPKMQRSKKLYASLEALNKKDLSDTDIKPKKGRVTTIKSYSSDTELEISQRAEKISKKIAKVKKMPSKTKD